MCFGPGPSFAAGAILTAVGAATLQESRSKRERFFALVPSVFGAHQFIEGALWLVIARPALKAVEPYLTLSYLLVAYCVWPILFPLSLYLLEPNSAKKRDLLWLLGFGAATGLVLFGFVITGPAQASMVHCSLQYRTNVPDVQWLGVFYVAAVLAPFFASSYRPIHVIGLINFIFYMVAYLYYSATFTSVWCFFASALSLNIYLFFRWKHHRKLLPRLRLLKVA